MMQFLHSRNASMASNDGASAQFKTQYLVLYLLCSDFTSRDFLSKFATLNGVFEIIIII